MSRPSAAVPRRPRPAQRLLALAMVAFALVSLSREFSLLSEHFTWVGLRFALERHPISWLLLGAGVVSLCRRCR